MAFTVFGELESKTHAACSVSVTTALDNNRQLKNIMNKAHCRARDCGPAALAAAAALLARDAAAEAADAAAAAPDVPATCSQLHQTDQVVRASAEIAISKLQLTKRWSALGKHGRGKILQRLQCPSTTG